MKSKVTLTHTEVVCFEHSALQKRKKTYESKKKQNASIFCYKEKVIFFYFVSCNLVTTSKQCFVRSFYMRKKSEGIENKSNLYSLFIISCNLSFVFLFL